MEDTVRRRRRPLLTIVALATVASIVLVGVAWWSVQRSPAITTYPDVNPPQIEWSVLPSIPGSVTANVGGAVGLMFRVGPDAFDARADRLYVALDRRLVALDPSDGSAYWWRALDNATGPTVANFGGYVAGPADYRTYVGTGPDTLRAFNDTSPGDPTIDDIAAGARVVGMAAYVSDMDPGRAEQDLVLVATAGGELLAVRATNHTIAWRTVFPSRVRLAEQRTATIVVPTYSTAFNAQGTRVFVATEGDGVAFAVNTSSGQTLFPFSAADVSAAPVAYPYFGGTRVLIGQGDGSLRIFDEGGTDIADLKVTTDPISSIATDGARAVVLSQSGEMVAVELDEGGAFPALRWRAQLAGEPSGPAEFLSSVGFVIVGDRTGRVTGFLLSGSLEFRSKICDSVTAGPTWWTPVGSSNPSIWIGCGDGSVYSLDARRRPVP